VVIAVVLFGGLFVYDLGVAMYSVNQESLVVSVTDDPNERASISMMRKYIILVPGILVGIVPTWLFTSGFTDEQILSYLFWLGSAAFFVTLVAVSREREPPHIYERLTKSGARAVVEEEPLRIRPALAHTFRSKPFLIYLGFCFCMSAVSGTYYSFILYYLDDLLHVPQLLAILISGAGGAVINVMYLVFKRLRTRWGSQRTLLMALAIGMIGYLSLFFVQHWIHLLFGYAVATVGLSAYWLLNDVIFGDVVDEDYVRTGERRPGMFSGIKALLLTPATGIMILIFTAILGATGYDGSLGQQPDAALLGIRVGVALVPFIFMLLAFCFLLRYPLTGDRLVEIKRHLHEMAGIDADVHL
jgi:GPH family glycoside/pentoside/hexuronide:cation symporter